LSLIACSGADDDIIVLFIHSFVSKGR